MLFMGLSGLPRKSGIPVVNNPPANAGDKRQEMRVRSLGQEDPLEKEMIPHSSFLARRIPWTEEPGDLQYMTLQIIGHD